MLRHLGHLHPGVTVVGPADVGADQLAEQSLLGIAHPIAPDPLTGNGGVVLERARHHPSVDGVLELFAGARARSNRRDRLGQLPVVERSDQVEAGPFPRTSTAVPARGPWWMWHGSEPMKLGVMTSRSPRTRQFRLR